jgi:putative ABC transport system permease protein
MSFLVRDFRHAFRSILRTPLVTILAIVAFALGIGMTTTVFSIFNSVLLEPLPYPDSEQLVVVYDTQPACATCPASYPKYDDWRTRNHVFAAIGGSAPTWLVLTGVGDPQRLPGMTTTASLADVLRVRAALGRWFTPDEDRPGARKVAVVSHKLWMSHFNGSRGILGRRIVLDGEPHDIIGVMPETFSHRRADLFVPLARKLDPATRGSHFLATYARLKPGVSLERARTEMRALGVTLAREFGHNHGIDVQSYYEATVGGVRASLRVLLGAVFVVLIIGCANVANLLLAVGLARRRELGIRLALGAKPWDLARQLTAESVLLAIAGGVLGLVLAFWSVRAFVALAATQLPRATSIAMDGRVLLFSGATTLLVGVLCGLWPLLRLRAGELAAAVREGDTRTSSGSGMRVGNGLVVAEIALAFALLVGGGLLIKNLVLLQKRDAGFRTAGMVAFDVAPSGPRYESPEQLKVFYRELYDRISRVDRVQRAGLISHLPMYRFGYNGDMQIEGKAPWTADATPLVEYRWYYGEYFKAMGVPLLRGRMLDSRDAGDKSRTAVINDSMAKKFWPGQDPIGKRFGQGSDRSAWYEVVGVVGDVRSYGLAQRSPYEFYRTVDQDSFAMMTVVLQAQAGTDPTALVPTARQIVRSIDAGMPVTEVQTLEAVVASSVGTQRLISALTGVFGGLAALLAMVGVYGVMAYNVRRQRRELGIRLAMGADRSSVRNLVMRRGLALALAGSLIGAFAAWLLTGTLRALLNDVTPRDPAIFAGTACVVFLAALLASYLPARAAGSVDPMIVLRDS